MSWWGKVLGGIFGYLVNGPITALIGVALGHAVDSLGSGSSKQSQYARSKKNAQHAARALYFTSTFSAVAFPSISILYKRLTCPNSSLRSDELHLAGWLVAGS